MRNMDWIALLSTLLVLLFFTVQTESVMRKKIRIHIPQKVKHIHHHRKIYITQHKAPSTAFAPLFASADHYAPAFPAEATATAIALLPLSEERRSSPTIPPTMPNLQPLYRARGHYGPSPVYGESQHKPQRHNEGRHGNTSSSKTKLKIVKINESSGDKKVKTNKRKKPKRIVIKEDKDNDGVSTFHDEFYSDINSGIVKKVKKPKRIEKIIDGDTEHIHTYTEEHIHQFVFDDQAGKVQSGEAPAILPLASFGPGPLEASATSHTLMPLDMALHHAAESAIYPTTIPVHKQRQEHSMFGDMGTLGSMGTPAHMEYVAYDPTEVTHDHMYHDHGELVSDMHFNKGIPSIPKATYNGQGIKINSSFKKSKLPQYKGKESWVPIDSKPKGTEVHSDIITYAPHFKSKPKKVPNYTSQKYSDHEGEIHLASDMSFEDSDMSHTTTTFFGNNENSKKKHKRRPSAPVIYHEVSTTKKPKTTTRPHNIYKSPYAMKPYGGLTSFGDGSPHKLYKDLFADTSVAYASNYGNYRDAYRPEPLEEAYPTYSTEYKRDSERPVWRPKRNRNKKKSVSTQNMSFGGQDHMTVIDHINDSSNLSPSIEPSPYSLFKEPIVADYGYSSAESYYNDMTSKSNLGGMLSAEASNTNFRIVGPPQLGHQEEQSQHSELTTATPEPTTQSPAPAAVTTTSRPRRLLRKKSAAEKKQLKEQQQQQQQQQQHHHHHQQHQQQQQKHEESGNKGGSPTRTSRGRFKYGDKLQERYDYEDLDTLYV